MIYHLFALGRGQESYQSPSEVGYDVLSIYILQILILKRGDIFNGRVGSLLSQLFFSLRWIVFGLGGDGWCRHQLIYGWGEKNVIHAPLKLVVNGGWR